MKKTRNYWTKEKCQEVALLCNSRKEFCKKYKGAYDNARFNNFLDDICSHMKSISKPNGFWTKEKCQEVAILCFSRKEFKIKYESAYRKSLEKKWLDNICLHMTQLIKPNGYWTKEKCQEVSLLCKYRNDFQQLYATAYNVSLENKWLDDICLHMIPCGNLNKRLIYLFKFTDNSVYIGLTGNIERRKNEHLCERKRNTSVYKHILKTGLTPELIHLTDYLDVEEAIKMEKYYIQLYKNDGFNLINNDRGGTIGYGGKNWNYKTYKRKK